MKDDFITRDELSLFDKNFSIVPLTFDSMFKAMFTYDLDILKEFLILETGLNLNPLETSITLLNTELMKDRVKEYKKTIDVYVILNDVISINCELNHSNFNDYLMIRNELYASKLFTNMFEKGDSKEKFLSKELIQLNLNTENLTLEYGEDVILPYGVNTKKFYNQNKKTILKYLAYYKKLYYNHVRKLDKAELWLVVILSENLVELYDLLGKLLPLEKRDKFIRKVIEMSNDEFILSEWEKEKMDYLKEMARIKDAEDKGLERGLERGFEQGLEQGIEQGIQENQREVVTSMYQNGISLDMISKCVRLDILEIEKIINENK